MRFFSNRLSGLRVLLISLLAGSVTQGHAQQNTTDRTILSIERNKVDNTPKSITFSPDTKWSDNQDNEVFSKYLDIKGDYSMVLRNTTRTKTGTVVKRYDEYYKSIKIEYATTTLMSKDGRTSFLTANSYVTDNLLNTTAGISEATALKSALDMVQAQKYMWENAGMERMIKARYHKDTSYYPHGQLVFIEDFSKGMVTDRSLHLAYKFDVFAQTPVSHKEIFVDANTGKVLFSNDLIKHTAATGASKYSGTVPFQTNFSAVDGGYILEDITTGGGVHTWNMNNGTDYSVATEFVSPLNTWPSAPSDDIAIDVHWGATMVYQFWDTQMGRLSWDNADGPLYSFVHYDVGYNNAFWDGAEMTYGDGTGCSAGFDPLVSLDVTGHEIGHGVCQGTANLVYASESGAMNEGFSDCWGASIENWANPHEVDAVAKSVWAIGEEVDCGNPLRRMDNPKLKGDPDTYGGTNWVSVVSCVPSSGNDQCGVHTNSGVLNKWYYLVTAGDGLPHTNDLSNSYVVTGLGFTKSQDILYQTELTLASTANYADARTASINVAMTLYGPCSNEVQQVTNAWYAVGVGTAFVPCVPNIGFTTTSLKVSENAAATACPASKTYTISLKPYGPAFTGGNPVVNIFSAHGNAVSGVDYTLSPTSLTFPVGSTAAQNVTLTVFDNGAVRDDKNMVLTYTLNPMGSDATRSTTNDSMYVTIYNDDSIPDVGHNEYHTLDWGTSVTSNLTSAFPGANSREHTQYLLYASELVTAGVKPNIAISQIAFTIVNKNTTAPFVGYTVSMGNSTFSDMSSIFATGLTTVYNSNHSTIVGVDSLDFNMGTFTWDGTSNVIVDICYGKNASAPGNDQMLGIDHSGIVCDHNGTTGGSGTGCGLPFSSSSSDMSTARPVMRFKQYVPPTAIEVAIGSNHVWDTRTGQEVYYYNTSNGNVIAGVKNPSADLGCTNATVSKQGIGFSPASFSPINRSLKEITVTPTTNTGSTYDFTMYMTTAELNAVPPGTLYLVKTSAPTDATVNTSNSTVVTPTLITGANYVGFKGTFTGFGRYFLTDGPICDKPVPVITPAGPTTFCTGGTVTFNANTGAGFVYQWQLGGVDISGATTSSYVASLAGNYTVTEYSGACTDISSGTTVTLLTTNAGTITGPTSVCTGQTLTLSNAVTGGTWASGNTAVATVGSTGAVSGVSAGTAEISYSATNVCGTATTTTTVTVSNPIAVAPITGALGVCQGSSTALSDVTPAGVWRSGNTSIATVGGSGLVNSVTTGVVSISYSVTNAFGCVSSAVAAVSVNALPAAVITPLGSTTICSGGSVTMSASSGAGLTYQWKIGGVDISGATTSSYTASAAGSYTVLITNASGCSQTSAPVTVTVGTIVVVPSVSINATPGTVVCATGTTVSYTPVPVNGGLTPAYDWYVNGTLVSSAPGYAYTPANGDIVKVKLTSSAACASPDTAWANLTMSVGVLATPSVTVTASPGSTVCAGTKTTFTPIPSFGGTSPSYQWFKNGSYLGAFPSYTYIPVNGDAVSVTMSSSYPCLSAPSATSDPLIMNIQPLSLNKDSIYATRRVVGAGELDTFVVIAPHGGSAPAYQWYVNSVAVPGETSAMFVTSALSDGDVVMCTVTSSDPCAYPATGKSNSLTMHVGSIVREGISGLNGLTLTPNPSKGTFVISGAINSGNSDMNVTVTNMLGQVVHKQSATPKNSAVNIEIALPASLANGTYLVNVTSAEEHVVFHLVLDK